MKILIITWQLVQRTLRQRPGRQPFNMSGVMFLFAPSASVVASEKDVDRTCTGSLLQCPQNLLQSTHATYYIHDDVGSAAEPDVVFSVIGVRRNELFVAAEAEWM